jgi:hypothetical protein
MVSSHAPYFTQIQGTYHGAVVDQWSKTLARPKRMRSLQNAMPFLKNSPATGGITANTIGSHDLHVVALSRLSWTGPGLMMSS